MLFSNQLVNAITQNQSQEQWEKKTYKYAKNLAAAYGTHFTLMAAHHVGHLLGAQLAVSSGYSIATINPRFELKPSMYGLQINSKHPLFESHKVNIAVELAGPAFGIIAAICTLKLWQYLQTDKKNKNLKDEILASFKESESETLVAIPLMALAHIGFNVGALSPINHDAFDGYRIAKNMGWIK